MPRVPVTARLDASQLKKAQKAIGAKTTTETLQKALDLITEKEAHDKVLRKYSRVGKVDAFKED